MSFGILILELLPFDVERWDELGSIVQGSLIASTLVLTEWFRLGFQTSRRK